MSVNSTFQATAVFEPPMALPPARASRLAHWLRALAASFRDVPPDFRDSGTGLHNRTGLFDVADEILRSRCGQPAAMILVELSDLREACEIYGHVIARKVIERVVRRLRRVAGLHGIAARTGPAEFTIVVPDTSTASAVRRLERMLGKPARIEYDAAESEIVLVPELLVDTLDPGVDDPRDRYREMCRELARRRRVERRRLDWLASERERHSRPSLPSRLTPG
jgi:diguanylate cyclase (GGDEF)-like protein